MHSLIHLDKYSPPRLSVSLYFSTCKKMPLFFMRTAESPYPFFIFARILFFLLPLMSLSSWTTLDCSPSRFPSIQILNQNNVQVMKCGDVVDCNACLSGIFSPLLPHILIYHFPYCECFVTWYSQSQVINQHYPLQLNSILYSGFIIIFSRVLFSDLGYYPRYHIPFSHHGSAPSHLRKFIIFFLIYDCKNIE